MAGKLLDNIKEIKGIKTLAVEVSVKDPKELRAMADAIRTKLGSGVVFLISEEDGKVERPRCRDKRPYEEVQRRRINKESRADYRRPRRQKKTWLRQEA